MATAVRGRSFPRRLPRSGPSCNPSVTVLPAGFKLLSRRVEGKDELRDQTANLRVTIVAPAGSAFRIARAVSGRQRPRSPGSLGKLPLAADFSILLIRQRTAFETAFSSCPWCPHDRAPSAHSPRPPVGNPTQWQLTRFEANPRPLVTEKGDEILTPTSTNIFQV